MHRELVELKRWISERRFLHALNYCMLLPGPEAQQLATYIGWLMHGPWGGIVAGLLFILPSFFILIALSWLYMAFGNLPAVEGILYGIKPAVTAIVLAAAWRIGVRTLHNTLLWILACAAFIAIFALSLPFPAIIAAAALIGFGLARFKPALLGKSRPAHAVASEMNDALIGDHTPTPAHCEYSHRRLALIATAALASGLGILLLLLSIFAWDSVPTQMAWFFTKAAFLTFGGAYAVLPYVFQAAVEQQQWLTAAQMMDGLALGETTPGPLIIVVAFVGFVGGWTDAMRDASDAFLSGPGIVGMAVLCASIATFFTFLPSFFFILAGGPLVEATHGELRLTGPLTCITAAVVGVIVNLAIFFAWKVLWPGATETDPFGGEFHWWAAIIALTGFVALVRWQANIMLLIGASALTGLAIRLL